MSPETMQLFMDCDWPGNVRELENLIKPAVVLGTEAPIRKEIAQTIALASHRVSVTQPARVAPVAVVVPPAALPTSIAAAAAGSGNYSLKDISRAAARDGLDKAS
jgi:transcriptional regulator with GAF, ATPase, and Fis domain